MEKAESRQMTVRLTSDELKRFYRFDIFHSERIVWYIVMIAIAFGIYIACARTWDNIIVPIAGGIFLAGLIFNIFVSSPAYAAEKNAPPPYGINVEFGFFGTYYTEQKKGVTLIVPYGGITRVFERNTAFYVYYDPMAVRSDDGKKRSGVASVISKEGLTEEETAFIRSLLCK